ncbi:hypothetical protein [Solirubrobacter soli]|uniref:hypothetical protein n=1 Tax=Solirubrobacter soli TaxID=363832 RepID=UPI00041CF896|nr:hypothetical protein [Solirubrobacter soli]
MKRTAHRGLVALLAAVAATVAAAPSALAEPPQYPTPMHNPNTVRLIDVPPVIDEGVLAMLASELQRAAAADDRVVVRASGSTGLAGPVDQRVIDTIAQFSQPGQWAVVIAPAAGGGTQGGGAAALYALAPTRLTLAGGRLTPVRDQALWAQLQGQAGDCQACQELSAGQPVGDLQDAGATLVRTPEDLLRAVSTSAERTVRLKLSEGDMAAVDEWLRPPKPTRATPKDEPGIPTPISILAGLAIGGLVGAAGVAATRRRGDGQPSGGIPPAGGTERRPQPPPLADFPAAPALAVNLPRSPAVVRTELYPDGYVELDGFLRRVRWAQDGVPAPAPGQPVDVVEGPQRELFALAAPARHRTTRSQQRTSRME